LSSIIMDQNQNAEFAAAADATHPDDSGAGAANHAHQTSAPDATTNQDLAPTAAPTANPASSGAETGAAVASSDDGSGDTYPQQSNAVPMPDVPVPIPVTVPVSVPGLLVNAPSPAGQMVSVPVPMDMINVPAPVPVPATVQDPVGATIITTTMVHLLHPNLHENNRQGWILYGTNISKSLKHTKRKMVPYPYPENLDNLANGVAPKGATTACIAVAKPFHSPENE
jgi:hypothetical protein